MCNKLQPEDIEWNFICSLALTTEHHAKMINKEFGLECEIITKKIDEFTFSKKPKVYYFITGQEKEYTDIKELCKDWNEIKNYDDPNNEIVWIKKIVKTKKLK